ncbi:hypothetical protein [Aquabacter sediminis]|uniref:hypothetical protein n=1 Tax=Aquabacter sediminis TaxID=3029197 RepID=UPI00237D7729|nr:hypothetical protein [Aquabacter sp. P-9]MDE1571093.1 hypothetical protein [Aquabacter sp. P-9]
MSAPAAFADSRPNAEAWLEGRYHEDLAPEAERAIRAAGLAWARPQEAERHLAEAERLAGDHLAVMIARYRYALYTHDFATALVQAERVLAAAARRLNIPADWREVRAGDADFSSDAPQVRFFLFVLQAYGYVLLRLDRLEEGTDALRRVTNLDVRDQTRTRILLKVILDRAEAGAE